MKRAPLQHLNSLPGFPMKNCQNSTLGNAKLIRQTARCLAGGCSDSDNFLWSQLRSLIVITVGQAVFLCGVVHVVLVCPNEKMVWTDATSIIAMVANHQAIWNWAEVDFPRKAVASVADSFYVEMAVSSRSVTRPNPAAFGFVYLGPESVLNRLTIHWEPRFPDVTLRAAPTAPGHFYYIAWW